MKFYLSLLLIVCFTLRTEAQLLSKSSTEKRTSLIETYTGHRAYYDSHAHKIVDDILSQNPNRVVAINLHCGGFAGWAPNYRSTVGSVDYGNQVYQHGDVKILGWPSASINRRNHGNGQLGGTSIGRDKFDSTVAVILNENSPVNVSVYPYHNASEGKLYVYVEAHFTSTQSVSTNKINVGIVQNNVWGSQNVGGTANSSYPANTDTTRPTGFQYKHNHMMRQVLTGQWGEVISDVRKGVTFTKTYVWNIPTKIGDVVAVPSDLEIYAFVAENQQTVLSAAIAKTTTKQLDFEATAIKVLSPVPGTGNSLLIGDPLTSLEITLKNNSSSTVHSGAEIPITIKVDGVSKSGTITLSSDWIASTTVTQTISDVSLFSAIPTTEKAFDICVSVDVTEDNLRSNNENCETYNAKNKFTQVVITDYNPKKGKVGTEVWIDGTGFNSDASKNIIKFNGTATTLILASSSITQLKVLVPAGATTGKISVSANNTDDTTSTDFTMEVTVGMQNEDIINSSFYYSNETIVYSPGKSNTSGKKELVIYTINGQELYREKLPDLSYENEAKISVSQLNTGVYIAKINGSSIRFVR